jgi:hypothetical protein
MTTPASTVSTPWQMRGTGYEFCNCDFGCGCNFGGVPNSNDGSCRALVGMHITEGSCGSVRLDGVKCGAIVVWPKAIHEGGGKLVFVVDTSTTDEQIGALADVFSGKLGGLPWELLGPTFEVVGLEKTRITIEGAGRKSTFRMDGIGEGRGDTLKNPVTGEDHIATVVLPDGFIWTKGECGQGAFKASAAGVSVDFQNTNWILYDFEWSNAVVGAAAAV